MATKILCILVLAGTVACGTTAVLFCDENTPCSDPSRPFCDLEGEFPDSEGHGRTCIANPFDAGVIPCTANETVCSADTLSVCDADGNLASQTECALGCHATELRCNKLDPSNGLASHLDDAETEGADIVLGDGATINTSTGEVLNGDGAAVAIPSVLLPAPTGGVAVRVFKVRSLALGDATISGGPAAAIVSVGDVEILGTLVVSPGTGEMLDAIVCAGFDDGGSLIYPGAGGGGFGSSGADGGAGGNGAPGLPGMATNGNERLEPLRGGCRGQLACTIPAEFVNCSCLPGQPCFSGRNAGGAVQISTHTEIRVGTATFVATLEAHGAGPTPAGLYNHGFGGNSGGGILLEAGSVVVDPSSAVAANGGGGSCFERGAGPGRTDGRTNGADCSASSAGNGGSGATRDRAAVEGSPGVGTDISGGGGGGGVGRVRVNTRDRLFTENGTLSPQPFLGEARIR